MVAADTIYDVLIIGGGPAGLNAALYASRYGLKPVVFAEQIGGAASEAVEVQNYLGFVSISGLELAEKFKAHATHYGADIIYDRVTELKKDGENFMADTVSGKTYHGKSVLLATGAKHRNLGCLGEKEFQGKGVAYCATCEGFFHKDKAVCVVGGGDAAFTAAIHLAKIAAKVYLICRDSEDGFKAEPIWIETAKKLPNIEFVLNNEIVEIKGDKFVNEVALKKPHNGQQSLKLQGVFIEIGSAPDPAIAKRLDVKLDKRDLIVVGPDQSTNIAGVYAAGENTTGSNQYNQIITTAAEGAIAAHSISQYLSKH